MMAQGLLATAVGVPYIFLITDGAVDNERTICQSVQIAMDAARQRGAADVSKMPRIWTFGIGQFCNHFFLKQLSTMGRGMSDAAFVPNRILSQMERMLEAAAKPVLTDVSLKMEGLPPGVEVYPFPIPDLFCGRPLIISGKYNGTMPKTISLHGSLPGGDVWDQDVSVTSAASIPLDKVFIKQRLDLLTAQAWMTNDPAMTQQVVNLSVASGVPCAHTAMVGFNVKRDNMVKVQQQRKAGNLKARKDTHKQAPTAAAAAPTHALLESHGRSMVGACWGLYDPLVSIRLSPAQSALASFGAATCVASDAPRALPLLLLPSLRRWRLSLSAAWPVSPSSAQWR